jgi:BirA family biotin operon repressor/biotin-[acetyl-CoA-carboxylase] ligase
MSDEWSATRVPEGWRLEILETVDSTNEWLKRGPAAAPGTVVVAERQTRGRGRRGAVWHSEPGHGLTFSVRLRPEAAKSLWSRFSLLAGLAVAQALERLGIEAGVKWPNDVWINGRKVAGILVEALDDAVIVGVGLNVGTRHFDGALAETATSLWLEGARGTTRAEVLELVLAALHRGAARMEHDFGDLLDGVRERCVLTGRAASLTLDGRETRGRVRGIGDRGELLFETAGGGLLSLIHADEVRPTD